MIGAITNSVQENNLQYVQYDFYHDLTVANPTDRQPEFECVKTLSNAIKVVQSKIDALKICFVHQHA